MKKLSFTLSRNSLLTIYKTFMRPILDYADTTSDRPLTEFFKDKSEIYQYNAALVITGATNGTSRDRIYRELSLKSLAERRWPCQISFFRKILNGLLPVYLQSYISYCSEGVYRTRSSSQKNFFYKNKNLFFPFCIKGWNNLSEEFQKIKSKVLFKTKILSFIRSKENSIFNIYDTSDIKLLDRLRLHFNHLNEHKFLHSFRATIDPLCSCSLEPNTTRHYVLPRNLYSDLRAELPNNICSLNPTLKYLSHENLLNILLCGSKDFSLNKNKKRIKSPIRFLKTSEQWPSLLTFCIAKNIE